MSKNDIQSSSNLFSEVAIKGIRSNTKKRGKAFYVSKSGTDITIEELVLEHYESEYYEGLWSENEYWWQIMTLLYWKVVFAKLPDVYNSLAGAFPSEMQDIPHDIFTLDFYKKREGLIKSRHASLTESSFFGLRSPSPSRDLKAAWKKHKGKKCRFFGDWDKFSVENLALSTKALSSKQLIQIMDRLLYEFRVNRSGLPDLFLVRNNAPLFVEVKSKREKIADNQKAWHEFLTNTVGINVEICRVIQDNSA